MSFDKAIEHNKEHRKEYEGIRRYLTSYRNHQTNSWAKHNRDVKLKKNKGMYLEKGGIIIEERRNNSRLY